MVGNYNVIKFIEQIKFDGWINVYLLVEIEKYALFKI